MDANDRYLLYFDEYQALICKQCEHAINGTANGISRHFRERHKIVQLATRKTLSRYGHQLRVTAPEQLFKPRNSTERIQGLKLQREFECQKCTLVCARSARARNTSSSTVAKFTDGRWTRARRWRRLEGHGDHVECKHFFHRIMEDISW